MNFEPALDTFNAIGYKILFFNVLEIIGIKHTKLPLITAFIIGSAFYFTILLKFVNFTNLKTSFKVSLQADDKNKSGQGISPIKSLFAVVSSSAGLGSIVSTCAAMYVGGAGTVFWMTIAPFVLSPIRYAEVFMAHKFREKVQGLYSGNPGIYLKKGLEGTKYAKLGVFLSVSYVAAMTLGSLGGGSSFQSNQFVAIYADTFEIFANNVTLLSLGFTSVIGYFIIKGSKSILQILGAITPYLIAIFLISSFAVIIKNYQNIIPGLQTVFKEAFSQNAAKGGILFVILLSFHRMTITTEAALGTACSIHSQSSREDSAEEAISSMAPPIVTTICVCFVTMLTVLSAQTYSQNLPGILMLKAAFATFSPALSYIVLLLTLLMSFNCIIAWGYYGLNAFKILFKTEKVIFFQIIYLLAVFGGGVTSSFDSILKLTDIVNTSTAIPNLIGLILASKLIKDGYNQFSLKHKNKNN